MNPLRFPFAVGAANVAAFVMLLNWVRRRRLASGMLRGDAEYSAVSSSGQELPAQESPEVEPPARRFSHMSAMEEYAAYFPRDEELSLCGFHPPAIADFDLTAFRSHDRRQGAQFQGGPSGLWLSFNLAGRIDFNLACDWGSPANCGSPAIVSRASLSVEAGQTVRVIDSSADDDDVFHEPTIRAVSAFVCVSPAGAAMQIRDPRASIAYLPSADDLAFCRAICAAPDDELPRLIYADWLQERGHTLARYMRNDAPFCLFEWVAVGQGWQGSSHGRVTWGQAIRALQDFCSQGEVAELPVTVGPTALTRQIVNPLRPDGRELRRLSVTLESGKPAPQMINDLFHELSRIIASEAAASPNA